jgi:hypothetical protein
MLSARTGLGTSGQSLALSYPIHVSSAIINSLIVRLIGYIAHFPAYYPTKLTLT